MRNKDSRLEAIKLLVSSQEISSQGELLRELRRVGFTPTQATLSRDLHRLKVAKAMSHTGKYVYMLPGSPLYRRVSDSALTFAAARQAGVLSVKFSGNLAVVHTLPGHASHVAYDIDFGRRRHHHHGAGRRGDARNRGTADGRGVARHGKKGKRL